jgi:hypothetical protein
LKEKNHELVSLLTCPEKTPTEQFWDTFDRMKKEMKNARIEDLAFQKKLIIAKGQNNITEYDKTVLSLIELEIDTLNGR